MTVYQKRDFVHLSEISEITGVPISTLYRWVAEGKIRHTKPGGGRILVSRDWLYKWLSGAAA